jgi:hypothetical protein
MAASAPLVSTFGAAGCVGRRGDDRGRNGAVRGGVAGFVSGQPVRVRGKLVPNARQLELAAGFGLSDFSKNMGHDDFSQRLRADDAADDSAKWITAANDDLATQLALTGVSVKWWKSSLASLGIELRS